VSARRPQQAIVLTRISDARDGDDHGVQGQEKDGRRLADRLEWTVGPGETHVIVENDTSAFRRRKVCRSCLQPTRACTCPPLPGGERHDTVLRTWRPEFRKALAMLRSGQADGLIAVDLDRACRDPRDLEDLIDVVESRTTRIPVESVSGSLRLANDADITMARVMVTVANKSSRDTGRRVAAQRQAKAERGEYGGGKRPYGWGVPKVDKATGEPVINEKTGRPVLDLGRKIDAEAAEVRQMADQVLAGVSLRAVAADLRERGVPSVTGAAWSSATVRDILKRPRNAGLAVYQVSAAAKAYRDRGEPVPYDVGVIGAGSWEPILLEDTWRAVAAMLADPARRTSPGNTPKWLGSLIYRCGVCAEQGIEETVSVANVSNDRGAAYLCRNTREGVRAGHIRRAALRVDDYVTEVIIARLSQPDALTLHQRPQVPDDRDKLNAELVSLRERSEQLAAAFADGAITSAQLREGSGRINGRIREIEAALARRLVRSPLDGLPLGTPDVAERWKRLPLGSQRAILRLLMDVTLLKGKPGRYADGAYFDGSSVEITWKR
jgi:DNA invertase Pin-like site-specific DNA recombinase